MMLHQKLAGGNTYRRQSLDSPVFSCLLLEGHVAVVHPVLCGDVDASLGIVLRSLLQHVVHDAFTVLPHVSQRPPHDVHGLIALPEKVLRLLQEQGDAGVGHDP